MLPRAYTGQVIVSVVVVALSLALSSDSHIDWGLYDRGGIARDEWWRFLTAHFTHLNTAHLALNLSAWILIWIYGWLVCSAWTWAWLIISTSLLTGLTIHFFEPGIHWHGGLSGILHGLFISVVLLKLRYDVLDWNAWIALAAVVGKLLWEWHNGAIPGSEELVEGRVLTEAHLHGFLNGLIVTLPLLIRRSRAQDTWGGSSAHTTDTS